MSNDERSTLGAYGRRVHFTSIDLTALTISKSQEHPWKFTSSRIKSNVRSHKASSIAHANLDCL